MSDVRLTRYIIQSLKDENTSHIFMVPGGYVDNFSVDLVEVTGITAIVCATEGGAAMMADGFARASGQFGVCLGISGPGASNMITGLSVSSADQVPVLVITGDTPLGWRDRDAIQDSGTHGLKTIELFRHIASVQHQIFDASLAGNYLKRCMSKLKGSSPGVAHLSVPLDLQAKEIAYNYQASRANRLDINRLIDRDSLDIALELASSHRKTVLLIGSGIRKSKASAALLTFAERFDIPVATTMCAKGDFPENHPLSLGVFGWAGTAIANETLMSDGVDCLIVVGSKLGQIASMSWSERLHANRKLIQIDLNSENLDKTYSADIAVTSDAGAAFEYFCGLSNEAESVAKLLDSKLARKDWLETLRATNTWHYESENQHTNLEPIHPARAISDLFSSMPEDTQLFVDNGAHTFFASHYWQSALANHYFNIIKYSGAMGWAIPASIGAKFSRPDKTTVAVVGDGCMLMHGMEIQTAARYKLTKMIFIVLNNKAHGNPKLRSGGFSTAAAELTNIVDHNWAGFAESLGVKGLSVDRPEALAATFESALASDTTVLIDIKCGLYPTPTKVFDETFMKDFNQYLGSKEA